MIYVEDSNFEDLYCGAVESLRLPMVADGLGGDDGFVRSLLW